MIRTDFSSDEAWRRVVEAALATSPEGFFANLHIVNDRRFEGKNPSVLAQAANSSSDHVLLIIADDRTMNEPDAPLLCVDPIPPGGQFRAIPQQIWGVENNVSIANMDFEEFASAVDTDGVFRGFRE